MSSVPQPESPFESQRSDSSTFVLTTKSIIEEAFDICQMGVEGEDLSDEMLSRALRSLNMMQRSWQAQGIHLWAFEEGTLFVNGGTREYVPEQCHATNSYWFSTTSLEALIDDTLLTINIPLQYYGVSIDAPRKDYVVGLLMPDREWWWTSVVDYNIQTGELTIADALTSDLPENTICVMYEKVLNPIERIIGVRRVDNLSYDTPVNFESGQRYFNLPSKLASGSVSEAFYERSLSAGVLYLWPTPKDGSQLIRFRYERKLFDFVALDDRADVPQYFYEAIAYNLAKRLAVKYRVPNDVYQQISQMADETLTEALNFDNENTDIMVSMNRGSR